MMISLIRMKNKMNKIIISIVITFSLITSAPTEQNEQSEYVIDQPGTITFTSGVKIKGKVEKPQVVIFMTKERSYTRGMEFDYSFKGDIMKPIELTPLIEGFSDSKK